MMDDESSTTVFLLLFFETIKTKFCYLKFLTLCTAYLWFTIRKSILALPKSTFNRSLKVNIFHSRFITTVLMLIVLLL